VDLYDLIADSTGCQFSHRSAKSLWGWILCSSNQGVIMSVR